MGDRAATADAGEAVIVGALLAGGRSVRMGGGHKFLRELGGITLFDRALARLSPQVERVVVSSSPSRAFAAPGLTVVDDVLPEVGPLGGIHAVLRWAANAYGPSTDIVTVPADTPFIPRDLVTRLFEARASAVAEIAVAVSQGGDHPVVAIWPASLHGALENWLATPRNRSVRAFLHSRAMTTALFDGPTDPFFNINTPTDLVTAESLAKMLDGT